MKINIWKFVMPMQRESVKDTLLLLAVTSLEGIRSDSESHWFTTVKVGGISSLTGGASPSISRCSFLLERNQQNLSWSLDQFLDCALKTEQRSGVVPCVGLHPSLDERRALDLHLKALPLS